MPEILGSPEAKAEKLERYKEQQTLTPELEDKIRDKIAKHEVYPDMVFCPNKGCGQPVNLEIKTDHIRLYCSICGYEKKLPRK
ncbi:IBR domain-containing protein [Patescibacteria group bacterium]|nr:IBR domain-containing protein [Patescibacteria group bacterium]MBU1907386.1 IBR domain-containing protein [Patescibacteria group bacterium]